MTVEAKVLGNTCNLGCTYCYQEPMRLAGNDRTTNTPDIDLMLEIADKKNEMIIVFGGEGLLVPLRDLEKIFKHSFDRHGKGGIQTNGSLVRDEHIELFKKYNISVGISIDGDGDLNSLRISKQKNKTTEELTDATMKNIEKLQKEGVGVGIIITVHKMNGTKERLPRLFEFIKKLEAIGITGGNIHLMEIDSKEAESYSLTSEENTYAFLEMAKFFEENPQLSYSPFNDMKHSILGANPRSCIWNSCDPLNTQAVYGIEGNGAISNCGMVNKEGVEWHKANDVNFMRDVVLYQTKPEHGGCSGCRFFLMCNGHCNGSAIGGDWRNKTMHCNTIKEMFKYYEDIHVKADKMPITLNADLIKSLESIYITDILERNIRHSIENLREIFDERTIQRIMKDENMTYVPVRKGELDA